jgi:CubicO group peptidase (beta-lactamase class C family)
MKSFACVLLGMLLVSNALALRDYTGASKHFAHQTETTNAASHVRRDVPAPVPAQTLLNIRNYVQKMMSCPSVQSPGYSFSAVRGDEVLIADSVGITDLRYNTPSVAETTWAIGSVSKFFTAILVGMVVDDGLLTWDTVVADVLPGFALNTRVGSTVTIADLVSMRVDVPRNDMVWFANEAGDEERLIRHFKDLIPAAEIRTAFIYNSFNFLFLGKIVELKTGKSWDQNIQERIFDPLGMTLSTPSVQAAMDAGHYAYGHLINDTSHTVVNTYPLNANVLTADDVKPAGGIHLTAQDAAKYLSAFLDPTFKGLLTAATAKRLVQGASITMYGYNGLTNAVVNYIDRPNGAIPLSLYAYGYGNIHGMYKGRHIALHNGGMIGQSSWFVSFPEDKLAFMMVANMDSLSGTGQFMFDAAVYARDQIVNDTEVSVNTETVCGRVFALPGWVDDNWRNGLGLVDTFTNQEISKWVGTYVHGFYGAIVVSARPGNRVYIKYGKLEGDLFRDTAGKLIWASIPGYYQVFTFSPSFILRNGRVVSATFGLENPDAVFSKLH